MYLCLLCSTSDISENSVRNISLASSVQKDKEGQQLLPIREILVPHSFKYFYMTLVWKWSKTPCPKIPSPTDYRWKSVVGQLKPVLYTNAPVLEAMLELRECNCKTGYIGQSCGCRMNNLVYTGLCGCGDICENIIFRITLGRDESGWFISNVLCKVCIASCHVSTKAEDYKI